MKNLLNKLVAFGKKLLSLMFVQGLKDGSKIEVMRQVELVTADKKPVSLSAGLATLVRFTVTKDMVDDDGLAVPVTVVYFAVANTSAQAPQAYWESLIASGAVKLA